MGVGEKLSLVCFRVIPCGLKVLGLCDSQVEEAVEDMRQYGASLVKPVANAVEVTRAHGASVLEKGRVGSPICRKHERVTSSYFNS